MKRMFLIEKIISIVASIFLTSAVVLAQQGIEEWGKACAVVMEPDVLKITYGNNSAEAFRDAMCGKYFQDTGGQFGLDVIDILDFSGGSRTVTRVEFCQNKEYVATSQTIYTYFSSTTSPDARQAFIACMKSFPAQHGYAAPLLATYTNQASNAIAVSAQWDKNVTQEQPMFRSLNTANISCDSPWKVNDGIPDKPTTILCKWTDNYSTGGFISINTNKGSGFVEAVRTITPLGSAVLDIKQSVLEITSYATITGPPVNTAELHNTGCWPFGNPPPYPLACFDNKWLAAYVRAPVPLPAGTAIADLAYIRSHLALNCNDHGNGSAAWNACGDTNRFRIVEENHDRITVERAFGSRALVVNLVAQIPVRSRVEKVIQTATYTFPKEAAGFQFSVRVPQDATGTFSVKWVDGIKETLQIGDSNSRLALVPATAGAPNPTSVGGERIYRYKVTWQATGFQPHVLYK
jgi:hypothetical protein